MNRLILILAAVTALGGSAAKAADPQNVITLLPISREVGTFGLEYERAFGATSWFLAGQVANPLDNQPIRAGLDLGLRFYPFAPAPRWFFVGPHLGVEYFDAARTGIAAKTGGFRVGASAGLNLLIGDLVLLTGSVGGEYFRDYTFSTGDGEIRTDRYDLRLIYRAGLGFAF